MTCPFAAPSLPQAPDHELGPSLASQHRRCGPDTVPDAVFFADSLFFGRRIRLVLGASAMALAGCMHLELSAPSEPSTPMEPSASSAAAANWPQQPVDPRPHAPAARWEHYTLPGKTPSRYSVTRKDGRDAMVVDAASSVSLKRMRLQVPPQDLGTLRFSWQVPALIDRADMARADLDDSVVRIVLVFDGDRQRFSARNAMLSELARTLTGEELPYATLMYVWCNRRAAGEVIANPRTDRIRKIVVESGTNRLGQWIDYERDIRADYEKAFGEPAGALLSVALMTDTDNTRSRARAWYGPVRLEPR